MGRSIEKQLSELYISNLDIIGEGLPEYVNAARREYIENFMLLSLPTSEDERYRHCDLGELFAGDWEYYFTPQSGTVPVPEPISEDAWNLDIFNGFYRGEEPLATLENGIVYGSLKQAMTDCPDIIRRYYNTSADNEKEAVTALNSAFVQDGAFIYVPAGVEAGNTFVINFGYDSQDRAQMSFPRALIVAEENSATDVAVFHTNNGEARFLVNFVRETVAGDNARLNITEYGDMGGCSVLIAGSYVRQNAGSKVGSVNLWSKGGVIRVNSDARLEGSGCEGNFYSAYFGTDRQTVDINMQVGHAAPDCKSFQIVKGVVSDEATGAFTGRIHVVRDAQRTSAFQQSRNLQLSGYSKIYTEPQLEIYADDVKCSHGATVGQMDEEAVFYMRQRGVGELEAKKLQLSGFINDVVSRCPSERVREHIARLAGERISKL